ncbi:MAG TPA: hypothetical protein PK370_03405 [Candidatus Woesebacteria bacterium]|nr:hypothetical protein [Candidatus Woesebacteria bacterium]
MLAKTSWFSIRKYGGWGLTPNCYQGWLYVILVILPYFFIKNNYFITAWSILIFVDFITIFLTLKKDERESLHESIADRNALWMMILVLVAGSIVTQTANPIILAALIAGAVVKTITSFYLKDK